LTAVLTLTVDTSEGRRKFGVFADAIKDLTPVLREFDKYKRARIQELFATGGHGQWAPRSERTDQRAAARLRDAETRAPTTLLKKLKRDHARAVARFEKLDATAPAKRVNSGRNAVARRAFAVQAFEKVAAGIFEQVDAKQEKILRRIAPRWERAQQRAAKKGNLLGGLAQTIESNISRGLLTIDSSWDSPAPAALQEGATVGHGAKLPGREWLSWEDADVDVLADLFEKRAMLAWR
jgi:hypothetical protein